MSRRAFSVLLAGLTPGFWPAEMLKSYRDVGNAAMRDDFDGLFSINSFILLLFI